MNTKVFTHVETMKMTSTQCSLATASHKVHCTLM